MNNIPLNPHERPPSESRSPISRMSNFIGRVFTPKKTEGSHVVAAAALPIKKASTTKPKYLLGRAAKLGDMNAMQELIKQGFDLNEEDARGFTPLMQALLKGSVEAVELLLENGADPRKITTHGITPLSLAIIKGRLNILDVLLDKLGDLGTDTFYAPPIDSNPLAQALILGKVDIAKKLLDRGFNPNIGFSNGESYITGLKRVKYSNWKKMVSIIKASSFLDKTRDQQDSLLLRTSYLAQVFELSGTVQVGDHILDLEGESPALTVYNVSKSLTEFDLFFPTMMESPTLHYITSALKAASEFNIHDSRLLWTSISNGDLVILPTGYLGHSAILIFWKDRICLCDRGGLNHVELFVGHYNKEKFTEKQVIELYELQKKPREDYRAYISTGNFFASIDFKSNECDLTIQSFAALPAQTVGNCSFASIQEAVKVLFLLSKIEASMSSSLQPFKKSLDSCYNTWNLFNKLLALDKYVETAKSQVNQQIIIKSFESIWKEAKSCTPDRRLQDMIDKLELKYFYVADYNHKNVFIAVKAAIFSNSNPAEIN